MMLDYFKQCPSRSAKGKRLLMVPTYFELRDENAFEPNSPLYSAWVKFESK